MRADEGTINQGYEADAGTDYVFDRSADSGGHDRGAERAVEYGIWLYRVSIRTVCGDNDQL